MLIHATGRHIPTGKTVFFSMEFRPDYDEDFTVDVFVDSTTSSIEVFSARLDELDLVKEEK